MAAPSMARKNQIANGIAANIPAIAGAPNTSEPAQPLRAKLLKLKAGATTPMNTSNSATASTQTTNSKVAASFTPRMFRPMNTM
ncbi:hypothetical protein D3C87_1552330 [compost metagenome]